jgi:DNA-binding transcriptional regulator GbsR (MarR family)
MAEAGIFATRVDIDVRELQDWYIAHERPIDGSGRAVFTVEKLRQLHKGKQRW